MLIIQGWLTRNPVEKKRQTVKTVKNYLKLFVLIDQHIQFFSYIKFVLAAKPDGFIPITVNLILGKWHKIGVGGPILLFRC